VAVDLVGPFPTATGGYKFLLTVIDLATRWPEAIPLRTTTSKVIERELVKVFSRCGFPTALVSDNGPQFTGRQFERWLSSKGIRHIKSSPYHPQGNGVVERLHRTLNQMVAKTTGSKGNWAAVVPMALFFIRASPCEATGISPFLARQGWEPSTPIELLYRAWVQEDLGGVDLEEWVILNCERVEGEREKTEERLRETALKRKKEWDRKARERTFKEGDSVWMRKPGSCNKLEESWQGPFIVRAKNSVLSYAIDVGDRVIPSVHIQLLKEHRVNEDEILQIDRATVVLEPDQPDDNITDRYAELVVKGGELTDEQRKDISDICKQFDKTLTKEPGLTSIAEFAIETGSNEAISQRPYNTPAHFRESVDQEIDWLLEMGYIERSSSDWASPIVCVRKPDGSARLCVDFKRLNAITKPLPFYMPRVEEVLEGVGKAKFISKMDLAKGYYQLQVCPADRPKTAFVCHRGKFQFNRMPFGVRNAPAVFQELMDQILRNEREFCSPYMDDVVIYSMCWEDHVRHIRRVLERLSEAGLTANPKKCCWGGQSIEFLGHQVGGGMMALPEHRVEALSNYTKPTTKRGLRAFLGAISFYRRYVKRLASQTAVLTPLTAKAAPSRLVWTVISSSCAMCIPLPSDTFSIVSDASGLGVGGVLQVWRDERWEAAAFFSRQLKGAEQRYSATELEALALVETIAHFSYYLYGKQFIAFTDHKPLLQLTTSEKLNARLRRMAYKLQPWLMTVQYIEGQENGMADALSREERREPDEDELYSTMEHRLARGDVAGTTAT